MAYTLTFTGRPALLAPIVERVALASFRRETRGRLRALAAYLQAARLADRGSGPAPL